MSSPIIMPPISDKSRERCPECGKDEDIKRVCSHCGWEYKDLEFPPLPWYHPVIGAILGLASAVLICWVFHYFGWDQ